MMMRVLNLALYLSFCGLLGTGALLFWRLIPGSEGGRGLSLFGWSRHDWGDVHFWTGVVFLAATVLHLWVHRLWLKKIAGGAGMWRLWLGLLAGVMLVGFFVVMPLDDRNGGPGGQAEIESHGGRGEDDEKQREGKKRPNKNKAGKKAGKKAKKDARAGQKSGQEVNEGERRKRLRYRGGAG